jgi:hypothetical protein
MLRFRRRFSSLLTLEMMYLLGLKRIMLLQITSYNTALSFMVATYGEFVIFPGGKTAFKIINNSKPLLFH